MPPATHINGNSLPTDVLGKRCASKVTLYNWWCALQLLPPLSHLLVLSLVLGGSFLHGTTLLWETIFMDPSAGSGEDCSCKSPLCHAGKMTDFTQDFLGKSQIPLYFQWRSCYVASSWVVFFVFWVSRSVHRFVGAAGQRVEFPHPHCLLYSAGRMPSPPARGKLPSTAACSTCLTSITSP